jgi:hypothetical protein
MGAIETVSVRAYRPGDDHWMQAAVAGAKPVYRADGWTPFRQKVFLESLARGDTVELACAGVGLSVASAYAFKNRANGAAFALGWAAAKLLARDRLADTLMTRAVEGQTETVTYPDGRTVDRRRFDNRLALGLLTRLDRQAEANNAATHAARLIAQEFEAFTEALARDDSPARAGLFLGSRAAAEASADLAPVVALARADRFSRTGAAMAQEVDVSDLDLAQRAGWTAEQWQRAEAAGLLAVAAPQAPLPQLPDDEEPEIEEDEEEEYVPVWRDRCGDWVTSFPPPEDFDGHEEGTYGEDDYQRELTEAEAEAWTRIWNAAIDPERTASARLRDEFFGFAAPDPLRHSRESGNPEAPTEAANESVTGSAPAAAGMTSVAEESPPHPAPSNSRTSTLDASNPSISLA